MMAWRRTLLLFSLAAPLPAGCAELFLPDAAPWAEETAQHEKKGMAVDIAAALQDRSGIPLTVTLMPMPRQIASLRAADHGFALIGSYQDLPDQIVRLGNGFELPIFAVAREEDPAPTAENLSQGRRVGMVRGGRHMMPAALAGMLTIEEFPDIAAGLKMLEARRLDALVISSPVIAALGEAGFAAHHLGAPQPLFAGRATLVASTAAASSKEGQSLAAAWDEMCRDGTVARILQGSAAALVK